MENKSNKSTPKIIGTKKDLVSISAIMKKVEGKVLFAEKIEYAKKTLSNLKSLPM